MTAQLAEKPLGYVGVSVLVTLTRSTTRTIAVGDRVLANYHRRLSREDTFRTNNNNDKINTAPRQSLMKSLNICSSGFLFLLPVWRLSHAVEVGRQLAQRLRQSIHNGSCPAIRLKQRCLATLCARSQARTSARTHGCDVE